MSMPQHNDFFTLESLATFAGAVGATAAVSNALQRAFSFNPRWLALAIAEAICVGVVLFTNPQAGFDLSVLAPKLFVAIVNGFLVFTSAAGLTGAAHTSLHSDSETEERKVIRKSGGRKTRTFFTPWFS